MKRRHGRPVAVGTPPATAGLDTGEPLRVVSWNVHKCRHPRLGEQLRALAGERSPHVFALQESRARLDVPAGYGGHHARSFRRPFARHGEGVMTLALSAADHAVRMRSSQRELFVFTPKAALMTSYRLLNRPGHLTVVNVHGLNFDPTGKQLGRQLDELHDAVEQLDGPLLVCGDFNTWNDARFDVVARAMCRLDLAEIAPDVPGGRKGRAGDKRIERVLGLDRRLHLDRLFARGFVQRRAAWLDAFDASDHVPLFAELDWT